MVEGKSLISYNINLILICRLIHLEIGNLSIMTITAQTGWSCDATDNVYVTCMARCSFVRDGVLYIKPTLTADEIGESNLENGYTMDMWGGSPADLCMGMLITFATDSGLYSVFVVT